nr:hypothetical protein [Tanacetum cinerariifolium]
MPSSWRGGYVINKVRDNVVVEGINKEVNVGSTMDVGSCEDEVLDLGDEMASYMSSSGGGFQLEDDFMMDMRLRFMLSLCNMMLFVISLILVLKVMVESSRFYCYSYDWLVFHM